MHGRRLSTGPRRWAARITITVTTTMAIMLGLAGAAFADGSWSTSEYSPCSKDWNFNRYGASALAHESYTAVTSDSRQAKISTARAWVDHLWDCGPSGADVKAYSIEIMIQFRFKGTNLSCSAGYPASVSCSVYGSYEYGTFTGTCSANVLSCSKSLGPLYFSAPPNGRFNNVAWMQTTVTLNRSDGNSYTWQTAWV